MKYIHTVFYWLGIIILCTYGIVEIIGVEAPTERDWIHLIDFATAAFVMACYHKIKGGESK